MKTTCMATLGIALFVGSAHAQLHDVDVILKVEDGRVVTKNFLPDTGEVIPWRVFSGRFGTAGFPNFTDDPGFDSTPGTFPPNTAIGIAIRQALRVWDDIDEHFELIPEERIEIERFSIRIQTPWTDPEPGQTLPSLQLGLGSSNGQIHVHPWYTIMSPASTGVYLLELEVWATGIETSEPLWIVFNQNSPQIVADRALAWAEDNLGGNGSECTPDFAPPFGVLDIFDIAEFFNLFDAQAPAADLAPPFGTWDELDIVAFMNLFDQGCP